MRTKLLLPLLVYLFSYGTGQAQLPNGSIAPDVTFTDINGNSYNLYSILDEGKSVIFDVFATWCGPCWNYHNTNTLKNVYNTYGPGGTDDIEIFMVETSPSTNEACLYGPSGCSGGTTGNWVSGTPYPIIHITGANAPTFAQDFDVPYYPTLYKICPNRKIYLVGQTSTQGWINWITSCNLEASATISNSICFNDGLGAIDQDITGGFGNINYSWSNGSSTQDLNNIDAGTYYCTVSEGQGHSVEVGPYIVEGSTSPLVPYVQQQGDVNCFGENTGFIDIAVNGGSPGYSFSWSNGAMTEDLFNISGGNYMLTVTDNLGCQEITSTFVYEPPMLTLSGFSTGENCGQMDGTITLFAGGGTGIYEYDLGNGQQYNNVFINLSAGGYAAVVTDDNFCTEEFALSVADIAGPTAEAGADEQISCSAPTVQLDGSGSSSGSNLVAIWSTTNGNIISGGNTLSPIVDQPGIYSLTINDTVNGCTAVDSTEVIGDITPPIADAGPDGILNCTNTSYLLNGNSSSSGTGIMYEWFDGSNVSIGTTIEITVSTADTFLLVVTDSGNGCSNQSTAIVTEDITDPTVDAGANAILTCLQTNVLLVGTSSATIPSYEWKNSQGAVIGTDSSIIVADADTYTLLVTDESNGCTNSDVVSVTQDVTSPIADAGTDAHLTCENVLATLGGNSSSGSSITYLWTDQNNNEHGNTAMIDVSQPGIFTLLVTDTNNGCQSQSFVVVTEDTNLPTADAGLDVELNCTNTSIVIGGNSSTGSQFDYQWLHNGNVAGNQINLEVTVPGFYLLEVTDTTNGCFAVDAVTVTENFEIPLVYAGPDGQLDCNTSVVTLTGTGNAASSNIAVAWENESGTTIGNNLSIDISSEGTYTLIVTDLDNGCSASDAAIVISSNDFPTATASVSGQLNCITNEVTLSGDGSSSGNNFDFLWMDSEGNSLSTSVEVIVTQSGTYSLVVTDNSNGCQASTDVIVEENFEVPIVNIALPEQFNCQSTSVSLDGSASSGNNIQFEWRDDQGGVISNNSTADVFSPGQYSLEITDGLNGCSDVAYVDVTELPELQVDLGTVQNVLCNGEFTGSASVITSGGEGPYSFLWSDGQLSATAIGLSEGTYNVVVSDQNGCESSADVYIGESDAINLSVSSTNETGDNQNDGTASATVSGGSGIFSFEWNNGLTSPNINNLPPGTYTLVVSDEYGCTATEVINISSFDCMLQVSTESTNVSCFGGSDGSISIEILQGEATNFSWNTGSSDPDISGLASGTYSYTVEDSNNCTIIDQVEITEPSLLEAMLINIEDISCIGGQGGSATVVATGGSGSYTYQWSNGENSVTASNLIAGTNTVIVIDDNNCEIVLDVIIAADDHEFPVVQTQDITVSLGADGNAVINSSLIDNGSSDDCGIAGIQLDQTVFNCSQIGVQQVILTVTDLSGNQSTGTALVTVKDDIAPTINCIPELVSYSCGPLQYPLPEAIDNCDNLTFNLIQGLPSGSVFPEGVTTIVYQVNDASGNEAECSFNIEVIHDLEVSVLGIDVLCNGEASGTAVASPDGGTPGYQYLWSNGQETATASGLVAGDYEVIVSDNGGCTVTRSTSISEPSSLELTIDHLENDSNGMGSGSIDITAGGGVSPYTYSWTLNGIFYSNEEDLTGLSAGNYAVAVLDANGCELEQFGMNIDNIVGIDDFDYSENIQVMPNPTNGELFVNFNFAESKNVDLSIIDLQGRALYGMTLNQVTKNKKRFNFDMLISGIYFMRINVEGEIIVRKIVVQK